MKPLIMKSAGKTPEVRKVRLQNKISPLRLHNKCGLYKAAQGEIPQIKLPPHFYTERTRAGQIIQASLCTCSLLFVLPGAYTYLIT